MTGYQMKRRIAAALCAAMMSGCMPFGALAEAIVSEAPQENAASVEAVAPQYTKIQASAEVSGTSIVVRASGMSNPVIRAVLDGSDSRNMNGTKYTFEDVAPGEHTVQVRYNAPDTGDYASNVITVTIEAPKSEEVIEQIVPAAAPVEQIAPAAAPVEQIAPAAAPVEQIAPAAAPAEQIAPAVAPAEQIVPAAALVEQIVPVDPVVIENIQQAEPLQDQVKQQEALIEEGPASPIVPAEDDGNDEPEAPVYSQINASVQTGEDSVTVTIVEASGEPMYIAVGEDWKTGLYKGDSATFDGLAPGEYDVEVDYEEGTNVFRTTATIEAKQDDSAPSGGSGDSDTTGGSGSTDGSGSADDSSSAGSVIPPASGDASSGASDEVKAFTVLPVVTDGTICVVIDGASDREIEITLLDANGKSVASSAIIGSGLATLGKFSSGAYTVRAQYVTPTQDADGNYDFKTVTAQAVVPEGVTAPEQTAPVDIQAKIETGTDYIIITVTEAADREMLVSVEGLGDKSIYKGNSVRYDGLAKGKTYGVEIDYVDYMEGAKKFSANVTIPAQAPADAPSITIDPVDINSWTVVAKTGANLRATLKTPDSTIASASGADGVVRFSLPHTYLNGDVFTLTVVYDETSGKSVSAQVTVKGIGNYKDLEYGDTGDDVLRLTTRLAELGYPISPTSRYGSAVRDAVKLFQAANGQEADGEAGDRMQAALYSVNAIPYNSGVYPTLMRGDKGLSLIYKLQQRLKDLGYYTIKVDGIFGSGTQRAVREFQRVNGLNVTGIADNATQTLLYSSAAKSADSIAVSGSYDTLSRSGKYKSAVVPLQRRLKALGYYSGNIDGYFGSQTYRAVRNFQNRNGLSVTGVADPYTQQVLYSSSAKSYSGSTSSSGTSSGYRLLYWGCRGDAVKRLQQALINAGYKSIVRKADGIFGQWTYDAVRAYQKDKGLAVDGIAGKNTQNALYGTSY